MTDRPKRSYNTTALQRGLRLLQLFSQSPRGLTAKQVADLSRLPVSTVHRFLANLETAGFLICNGDNVYHLGTRVLCDWAVGIGPTRYSPCQPALPARAESANEG